jgi:hypothetical protein
LRHNQWDRKIRRKGRDSLLDPQRLVPQPVLIEHVVCLIADKHLYFAGVDDFAPQEIRHRARRTDNDVRRDARDVTREMLLDGVLRLDIGEFAHGHDDGHDLASELS